MASTRLWSKGDVLLFESKIAMSMVHRGMSGEDGVTVNKVAKTSMGIYIVVMTQLFMKKRLDKQAPLVCSESCCKKSSKI